MMKLMGIGRFTSDPELRQAGDTNVCDFSLAYNEIRKKNDGTKEETAHFFDFVIWDKAAEVIVKYCKKGSKIMVEATPRQERWEKDGVKRSRVVFRVNNFTFVDNKSQDESKPAAEPVAAAVSAVDEVPF